MSDVEAKIEETPAPEFRFTEIETANKRIIDQEMEKAQMLAKNAELLGQLWAKDVMGRCGFKYGIVQKQDGTLKDGDPPLAK